MRYKPSIFNDMTHEQIMNTIKVSEESKTNAQQYIDKFKSANGNY